MGIPEPSDNVGFWESVKNKTIHQLWPPDDEQDAWELADRWRSVARTMDQTAQTFAAKATVSAQVWTDMAGAAYAYKLRRLSENFRLLAQNMNALADGMRDYGNQIREARINIIMELVANIVLFAALSAIPGGGFLAQGLARAVAGRLTAMIGRMIGQTATGGLSRALGMGARLGVEVGKEAVDESLINLGTQLTSMAMGTRNKFDLGELGRSAATGAVGGVLGEGLGRMAAPLSRATESTLAATRMPDGLARNLSAGLNSAVNNGITSPSAGYIVENYDNLSALTNLNGYTNAISENGLAAGITGAPRSMMVDSVQQMHPDRQAQVDNWANRFAGPDPGGGTPPSPDLPPADPSPPGGQPGGTGETGGQPADTNAPPAHTESGAGDTGGQPGTDPGQATGNTGADPGQAAGNTGGQAGADPGQAAGGRSGADSGQATGNTGADPGQAAGNAGGQSGQSGADSGQAAGNAGVQSGVDPGGAAGHAGGQASGQPSHTSIGDVAGQPGADNGGRSTGGVGETGGQTTSQPSGQPAGAADSAGQPGTGDSGAHHPTHTGTQPGETTGQPAAPPGETTGQASHTTDPGAGVNDPGQHTATTTDQQPGQQPGQPAGGTTTPGVAGVGPAAPASTAGPTATSAAGSTAAQPTTVPNHTTSTAAPGPSTPGQTAGPPASDSKGTKPSDRPAAPPTDPASSAPTGTTSTTGATSSAAPSTDPASSPTTGAASPEVAGESATGPARAEFVPHGGAAIATKAVAGASPPRRAAGQRPAHTVSGTPPGRPATSTTPPTRFRSTPPARGTGVVAGLAHTRFTVGHKTRNPGVVLRDAVNAMLSIALDAGVRAVYQVGPGEFSVTRRDGSVFTVTLAVGDTGTDLARVVEDQGTGRVTVSDRIGAAIPRAVANAVAQVDAILNNTPTGTDLLDGNSHPGDATTLSAADRGRIAEVRHLDRTHERTPAARVLRRRRIAREMKALVEHLGLHPDDDVQPHRSARAPEINDVVARHVRAGDRRPAWAKPPDGLPPWRSYLYRYLPAEVMPGLLGGATTTVVLTDATLGVVAVAAAATTGVTGTVVKRWTDRREAATSAAMGTYRTEQRERGPAEKLDRRVDEVLESYPAVDLAAPDPPGPQESPSPHQTVRHRLVKRAVPMGAGTTVYLASLPFGFPLWVALGHVGATVTMGLLGPPVDKYLTHRKNRRNWELADQVHRELHHAPESEVDRQFELAFLDRLRTLSGLLLLSTPTMADGPGSRHTDVTGDDLRKYGVDEAATNLPEGSRSTGTWNQRNEQTAAAVAKKDQRTGPGQTKDQPTLLDPTDAFITGGVRAVVLFIANALAARTFNLNDTSEANHQRRFDARAALVEQVRARYRHRLDALRELDRAIEQLTAAGHVIPNPDTNRITLPAPPRPPDPAHRPRGHPGRWSYRMMYGFQGAASTAGLGAAMAFATVPHTMLLPAVMMGVGLAASAPLRYRFRLDQQKASDAKASAGRATALVSGTHLARLDAEHVAELIERHRNALGRPNPPPPPSPPDVPATLDPHDSAFPADLRRLVDHEREVLHRDRTPYSRRPELLSALNRLDHLIGRIARAETGGPTDASNATREELGQRWADYRALRTDGTPMPTDHELLANEKPEGLRGGGPGTIVPDGLRPFVEDSTATPAGRAYYAPGDELLAEAHRVPPMPGAHTVDLHGGPDFVRVGSVRLTPADLAALIAADPNWRGHPVRLLACETGNAPDGFAQRLADELGVTVHAPSDLVGLGPDGHLFVTTTRVDAAGIVRPVTPATGGMRTFTPTRPEPPTPPESPRSPAGSRGLWWPDRGDVDLDVDLGPVQEPAPTGAAVHTGAERLWPDELAEILTAGDWAGGPVRIEVRGGQLGAPFVQRLADLLGVPVLVEDGAVGGTGHGPSSGTLAVFDTPSPPPGAWRVHQPRGIVTKGQP